MRNNSINSLFLQCVTFNNKEEYRMKATISLEGLLALIHGLSLSASNKRWLGEKLIEEARKETQSASIPASRFYGVMLLTCMLLKRRGCAWLVLLPMGKPVGTT